MFVNLITKPLIALSIVCSLLALSIGTASGQTNLDFEDWSSNQFGGDLPDGWANSNEWMMWGFPQSVFRDTIDPGEAVSSIKIVSVIHPTAWPPWASGVIVIGASSIGMKPGIPYQQRPTSLDFVYMSNPLNGDTASVEILLTRYDIALDSTVRVGSGILYFPNLVTTWSQASLNVTYYNSDTPDTLIIVAMSSNAIGVWPQSGSELYLDAFVINTPVAIEEENVGTEMGLYPNPVSGFALIDFKGKVEGATQIIICDLAGRQISVHHLKNGQEQLRINVESLTDGLYFANLYSSEGITGSLRFIVSK